jgi:transposase
MGGSKKREPWSGATDDRGIFWVLRSGAPWRDLPRAFGPHTTCYNRFVRWRRAGVWGRIMDALAAAHDAAVQMIDTSVVRVHQHAACIARNKRQSMGRSRGGLTSKIHVVVDRNGLPVRLALSTGEAHDNRLAEKLLSRLKSGSMLLADRGALHVRDVCGALCFQGAPHASRPSSYPQPFLKREVAQR